MLVVIPTQAVVALTIVQVRWGLTKHEPRVCQKSCIMGSKNCKALQSIHHRMCQKESRGFVSTWVVVKTMVPFWVLNIIRHLVFRDPKRDHSFDNHPHTIQCYPRL